MATETLDSKVHEEKLIAEPLYRSNDVFNEKTTINTPVEELIKQSKKDEEEKTANEDKAGTKVEEKEEEGKEESKVNEKKEVEPITSESLAKALREVFPQPKKEEVKEKPKLTQEEIDKHLEVWKPSDDWKKRLLDPDTQADAIVEMQAATVKQALAAAGFVTQDQVGRLRDEVTPVLTFAQKQQVTEWKSGFFEKYPTLKDQPPELLNMVVKSVYDAGFTPKDVNEEYTKIAETAEQLIKRFKPDFALGTVKKETKKSPKMSNLSSGNQGGAGGAPKSSEKPKLDGGLWDSKVSVL